MEASKQAAGVSKNTLDDLTYVSKSTFGDLTKSAKEAAAKKGLVKVFSIINAIKVLNTILFIFQIDTNQISREQQNQGTTLVSTSGGNITGRDFFSSITSDLNSITSSTTNMFSDFFGKKQPTGQQRPQNPQQPKQREKSSGGFDPFPGRKGLVERTPLIKHSGPSKTQEEIQRQQNAERSSSNSENQAFLKDVTQQVLNGEGVGWLKLNRLKKLMEDESYRTLVVGKINKTLDRKIAPDDHIDDVVSIYIFFTF